MGKKNIQDLILERVDKLGEKMDTLTTITIPAMSTAIAVAEETAKLKAKMTARFHGAMWGGLTLLVSIAGVAVAYFKHS